MIVTVHGETIAVERRAEEPFLEPKAGIAELTPSRREGWLAFLAGLLNVARLGREDCPVSQGKHRISDPVVMTGGQGRPRRLYGRCDCCGMDGVCLVEHA